jgi:hypothetical protein
MVTNGTFDSDLSGWNNAYGHPAVWDGLDANDSSSSGSVYLTNPYSNSLLRTLRQCIPVAPNTLYVFSAQVYLPSGQMDVGGGALRPEFYDNANCSGSGSAQYSDTVGVEDTWETASLEFTSPANAVAVGFWLAVESGDNPPLSVHFDEVSMVLGDTLIFEDGFESGNTSAWTSTVP